MVCCRWDQKGCLIHFIGTYFQLLLTLFAITEVCYFHSSWFLGRNEKISSVCLRMKLGKIAEDFIFLNIFKGSPLSWRHWYLFIGPDILNRFWKIGLYLLLVRPSPLCFLKLATSVNALVSLLGHWPTCRWMSRDWLLAPQNSWTFFRKADPEWSYQ